MSDDEYEDVEITLHPDGTAVAIHSDAAAALLATLGPIDVQRASDVEFSKAHGGWRIAFKPWTGLADPDMTFTTRVAALAHEVELLKQHDLFCGRCRNEPE